MAERPRQDSGHSKDKDVPQVPQQGAQPPQQSQIKNSAPQRAPVRVPWLNVQGPGQRLTPAPFLGVPTPKPASPPQSPLPNGREEPTKELTKSVFLRNKGTASVPVKVEIKKGLPPAAKPRVQASTRPPFPAGKLPNKGFLVRKWQPPLPAAQPTEGRGPSTAERFDFGRRTNEWDEFDDKIGFGGDARDRNLSAAHFPFTPPRDDGEEETVVGASRERVYSESEMLEASLITLTRQIKATRLTITRCMKNTNQLIPSEELREPSKLRENLLERLERADQGLVETQKKIFALELRGNMLNFDEQGKTMIVGATPETKDALELGQHLAAQTTEGGLVEGAIALKFLEEKAQKIVRVCEAQNEDHEGESDAEKIQKITQRYADELQQFLIQTPAKDVYKPFPAIELGVDKQKIEYEEKLKRLVTPAQREEE